MKNTPDYSTFHLHELADALKRIDESTNPEEAKIIREFMTRGGYVYPTEPETERVEFTNAAYKWVLVAVLSALFLLNMIILVTTHHLWSLVPMTFQGTILLMILNDYKYTRMLIKLWCALLMVSALFGFLSLYYASNVDISDVVEHIFKLGIGVVFIMLSDRYVKLIPITGSKS